MRRLAIAAVLVFAIGAIGASGADAGTGTYPSSSAARPAFGSVLHHRYGTVKGYWVCPTAQTVSNHGLSCLGEVRAGSIWHQASAVAYLKQGRVTIAGFRAVRWRRHSWPYSRYFIVRSHESQVPGTISVNSPAYDWGFLAGCAGGAEHHARTCDAYDGYGAGLFRFYTFKCSGSRSLVTCTNKLGDVMRYHP